MFRTTAERVFQSRICCDGYNSDSFGQLIVLLYSFESNSESCIRPMESCCEKNCKVFKKTSMMVKYKLFGKGAGFWLRRESTVDVIVGLARIY